MSMDLNFYVLLVLRTFLLDYCMLLYASYSYWLRLVVTSGVFN